MSWIETDEQSYNESLEILPPAAMAPMRFLLGEPWRHTPEGRPMFRAHVKAHGRYWRSAEPMTVATFHALDLSTVGA